MMRSLLFSLLIVVFAACSKSPEDLPKYKRKFQAQIASFETQKEKTNERVADGVETLTGLEQALENAKNVDAEFKRVYGDWEQVNKEVEDLNKQYEGLKMDAENLFSAMERQTNSLGDAKTRTELTNAIKTARGDYEKTLAKTAAAIESLRGLHTEAYDAVKSLEVAIALGQISEINAGLTSIEGRVAGIMADLNTTIADSKALYETRMGGL
ncbi:MAG: DUF2959 family protein [Bacteroidia bacterium]|nr:DUF2959 family protein [Bacteroidia bacterium]